MQSLPKKKLTKADYTKRANLLRKTGYEFDWKGNKASTWTPGQKAKITNLWENKGQFYLVNTEKNRLEFKRVRSKNSKRLWSGLASPEQIFPGGVFVQRPKGISKGEWSVRARKNGLSITGRGVWDFIVRLNMSEVALNPKRALEKTLRGRKRPRQLMLTTNGFDTSYQVEDLEQFNRYLEESLIPELREKEFNFKKWGNKVFGLRLVYTPKGRKKKKDEGKTFNFETGGIFDSSSKRVHGLKKYLGPKIPKTGKRKGK